MSQNIRQFSQIFFQFVNAPGMKGTFADEMYKGFQLVEKHDLLRYDNQLILKYQVPRNICNVMGFVHGGAFSTLVDVATTLAILKVDPEYRKTVSVDLGLHFLSPVKFDENILIQAQCTRLGKSIAYSDAQILTETDLQTAVTGRHVKAVLKDKWQF